MNDKVTSSNSSDYINNQLKGKGAQSNLFLSTYLITQYTKQELARERAHDGHHGNLCLHVGGEHTVILVLLHHQQGCKWVGWGRRAGKEGKNSQLLT